MNDQNHLSPGNGIRLKDSFVSFTSILSRDFPNTISADELQMLQFCHDWLNGTQTFTIHTSGSTGLPKSIQITREQMVQSAISTGKALHLKAGDTALVSLNTRYIGGMMMLVRGLVLGLNVWIVPASLSPFQELPGDVSFDFLSFVPMQIQAILEKSPGHIAMLNKAKAILVGGAPVSEGLEKQLQQIQSPVYQTYGMTETVSHIALRRINGTDKKEFYTTLPGVSIATDERDCLIIHTSFTWPGPVITNDVVEILSPNSFIWLGRIDNVINSGGIKVQAEKIERIAGQILLTLTINRRFFIAPLPHPQLGQTVTLFIEGAPLSKDTEIALLQAITAQTSRYEKPTSIIYIPAFLQTPSGKIDKLQTLHLHSGA